jgi:hypothetical protein
MLMSTRWALFGIRCIAIKKSIRFRGSNLMTRKSADASLGQAAIPLGHSVFLILSIMPSVCPSVRHSVRHPSVAMII